MRIEPEPEGESKGQLRLSPPLSLGLAPNWRIPTGRTDERLALFTFRVTVLVCMYIHYSIVAWFGRAEPLAGER